MTTNIQEHNGYGGNNQNAVANELFDPVSIETLANQLFATPPHSQEKSRSEEEGMSSISFNPTEVNLPLGLETLPTVPESNLQTNTTPNHPQVRDQGFSDSALTDLAKQLLSLQIPDLGAEIANYLATPSVENTPSPPQTVTDQELSDTGLTELAKQLYTQIPSISEISPPHSPPTSQGISTVFPLREGDLQNLITDIGTSENPKSLHQTEPEPPSYSFLSIPKVEKLNLNSHESFDVNAVRQDFPILHQEVNGKPLIWFDNAATTQKPQQVIDAISHFYERDNSNIHRGAHTLAARATDAYESAREKVQRFLGASDVSEIVFARGTTEAINLVAKTYGRKYIKEGDEIILSTIEHHANIVPWQMLAQETGAILKVIPITERGELILEEYTRLLGPKTKIVAVSQVSNALGTIIPVKEITTLAHRHGARVLIDGAQSVSHLAVNVQDLDCDFYVFSGHKLFAPTGIGALYAKREILDDMPPWQGGGAMIRHVTFERTIYSDPPEKFEAGTPNIADAVGLGAAIDYINRIGLANIERYEHFLTEYGMERLREVPYIRLIGTAPHKVGVFSFIHEQIPYEEIGKRLAAEGIAVRAGHHCAQPTMQRYGLTGTVRPSVAFYNTREEIDVLIEVLKQISYR